MNKLKSVISCKRVLSLFAICNLLVCNLLFSQSITNELGTGGVFRIKDVSNTFLSLGQSNGHLSLNRSLILPYTTSSTTGIIFKGSEWFLHDYRAPGTDGVNTFIGIESGNFTMGGSGIQGSYNTGVGYNTLNSLTTGNSNAAFGVNSLYTNYSGSDNSAFGNSTLFVNTTGYRNSAFGSSSLYYNTTGFYNSAFGYQSLYSNSTGMSNSAFGQGSLFFNTTGNYNTAYGNLTLYNNNTGDYNSAFGFGSLISNTVGLRNCAFGLYTLRFNTTGSFNSAFGDNALTYNTTGWNNSAFGLYALFYNTTGNYNSAFGDGALMNNTTGLRNSAFGRNTLVTNTTGSNNTAIGDDAQVPSGTASNQVRIGNTYVTYAGIQVQWSITSDRRWKSDIQSSNLGLNFISRLNPVSYTRNNDESKKTEYGLIAQEVEEALKESGADNCGMLNITDDGMYELRYNDLLAPMIKSIQELKAENDELKNEVQSLKTINEKVANLELIIEQLQKKDGSLKEIKTVEK